MRFVYFVTQAVSRAVLHLTCLLRPLTRQEGFFFSPLLQLDNILRSRSWLFNTNLQTRAC